MKAVIVQGSAVKCFPAQLPGTAWLKTVKVSK